MSAQEAEDTIEKDKPAIILSLEMDSVDTFQILGLVAIGVRHVVPIHLVDNNFGGTAVYSDAFNAVNNFLHSSRNGGDLKKSAVGQSLDTNERTMKRPSRPRI